MVSITNEDWALYEERYGKLMHTISMKISGDDAIANHEDNYADLCVAALESIDGFEKKTGEKFKEAINNKLFDQYTKAVLWNRKAKKGIPLSKRMEFTKKHKSIDYQYGDSLKASELIPDNRCASLQPSAHLKEFIEDQSEDVKKVIDAIIKNPKNIKVDGLFSYAGVRETTGLSTHNTIKAIKTLKEKLSKAYEV
tara:strand:+ start:1598 stop:2185 length:588 start_codon:yes stop_codon:yes gene_type:complete